MTLKRLIHQHATAALHQLVESGKRDCGQSWGPILVTSFEAFARALKAKRRKRS